MHRYPKMKGRRSEWHGEPSTHRSRRSRSPLMSDKRHNRPQKRAYRSSVRSSASGERLQDHRLRRSDHGREHREHSLTPQHWSHHRHRSLTPHDDAFKFQQDDIFRDPPPSNPSWGLSLPMKNREFEGQMNVALPSSYPYTERQHMVPQKPIFTEERPSQQLYSDQPMDSTLLNSNRLRISSGSVGMGIQDNGIYSRNDRHRDPYDESIGMGIQDNEIHSYGDRYSRDHYVDMDRKQVFSKDLSFPTMPPSQLKTSISGPSSSIFKEDLNDLHHNRISDGLATGIHRYLNDPLEQYSYHRVRHSDTLRHDLKDKSLVHDYDELSRRGLDDHRQRAQDELYEKISRPSRMKVTSSTTLKYNEDYMDRAGSPARNLIERTFSDHQASHFRDLSHDYHDAEAQREFPPNSDNWYGSLRIKPSRDYRTMPFEGSFASEKEYFQIPYGADHRNGRSLLSDHDLLEQRSVVSHNRSHIDDLSDHDIERMRQRNYALSDDVDENNLEVVFVNERHTSAPHGSEKLWLTEGAVEHSLSKSTLPGHSRYRKFSRSISRSDAFIPSPGASSMLAKNDHKINLKKRLKHIRSDFHNSSSSERKDDRRPYKYWKRGMDDKLGDQGENGSQFGKNDPPEDSEEFRQQVHKAFLRYSKLLNESPHNHRIYQNQGRTSSMLCSVCGSSSKEFADTNSLVIHTYHSHKVGLKTEHLGFHKALCVLLGWNWRIPPDTSRKYQSMHVSEAKATREDLILWPPLVIIHNGSIRGSSTTDAKVITIEDLEKILRDMGFGAGMRRVCHGNPASPGIFTVKFMPTFSGLQEAQRLHDHFSDKKRGKQEFQHTTSGGKANPDEAGGQTEETNGILYGYMAAAEDLDKVDHETKKRSVVKSKTDIQAIADAPLGTD